MNIKSKRPRQRPDETLGTEPKTMPRLDSEVKAKFGQHLRVLYSEVVNEGIPDRFVNILRTLDDHEHAGGIEDASRTEAKEVEGPRE
jgi:hypothetical protein